MNLKHIIDLTQQLHPERLAAGASGLTKAIVPAAIIPRQKEMRKMGTVNFLFTAFLLCDKIEEKEEA